MKPIVVVGSINMDLVSRVPRIPSPGETVLGSDFQLYSGGKGANQAVAVARLQHPSILLGMVGEDVFGQTLLRTLQGYGVQTQEIEVVRGSSGTASIAVDQSGENSIIVTPGANSLVTPEYLNRKEHILREAGMVLTQLEIPMETIRHLAVLCERLGVPLMLDPAPARQIEPATLARVAWFTPNQTEALFFGAGATDDKAVLDYLFKQGIRNAVLKQGATGALLAKAGGPRIPIKSFRVDAADTTAAGDAFNGAFAVALLSGKNEEESMRYAAAAAALSVSRPGAQSSLADKKDVDVFLSERAMQHYSESKV